MIKSVFPGVLVGLISFAGVALAEDKAITVPATMDKAFAERIISESVQRQNEAKNTIKDWSAAQLSEALTARLKGRTAVVFQPGHGVYAEFTSDDGLVFMWYSGNRRVVHGTWAVVAMGGQPRACYHYLQSTNPVTHVYEPTECIDPTQTMAEMGVIASRQGDIFNLRSDKVPYVKEPLDIPSPAQ